MKGGHETRENRQIINGFFLQEALLTLVALAICAVLLTQAVEMAGFHNQETVSQTIETEWFHHD